MRVLVVEDEKRLAGQLATALSGAGYAVDRAGDGNEADFLVQTEGYDAIILDLALPKIDGLTLLKRWRDLGIAVPIVILTARGAWHEKVQGIDGGADDYMAKPFEIEEVLAREKISQLFDWSRSISLESERFLDWIRDDGQLDPGLHAFRAGGYVLYHWVALQ